MTREQSDHMNDIQRQLAATATAVEAARVAAAGGTTRNLTLADAERHGVDRGRAEAKRSAELAGLRDLLNHPNAGLPASGVSSTDAARDFMRTASGGSAA